jgi:hypothetical protein
MVFYRVVRRIEDAGATSLNWFLYGTLIEAYRQCIPHDESDACRRLLNGVQSEIQKGERFIRVTCSRGDIWWIQLVDDPNEAVGPVTTKIDCCHAHQ